MALVDAIPVDPANVAQLRAWNGDEGAYWAARAERFDRAIEAHHRHFIRAAAISEGDRVLDIGCGTGLTTRDAARSAPAGGALGVDLSVAMLHHARKRAAAEGLENARFEQADAQVHRFEPGAFDAAISRTGAMFFGDPTAAFANIARAVRPGGRLVLLTWQALSASEWFRELTSALAVGRDLPVPPPGAPGPFSLADPEHVRSLLGSTGFTDVEVDGLEAGMWFGADVDDAHSFVLGQLGWMLEGLDETDRRKAADALRATMADHAGGDGVVYGSATWTVRAVRDPTDGTPAQR